MDAVHTENRLPHDQPPINTSDMKRLIVQANLLSSTEGSSTSVGLIVGASGTGKTLAAHAYRVNAEQEQRSRCAIIDVMPQITAKGLLSTILHQIGEDPRFRTSHDALLRTIDVLQQGKTRLLILDQGDYLERSTLEVLSLLVEKTPCSFLLVGLPHLRARLNMVPSFAGRVGLLLQFGPLPETEVYEVFLPQLVLSGWKFDPKSEEDLHIGRYLWKNARPSLRRLCTILGYASRLAQMSGSSKITFEDIRMAMRMTHFPDDWKENEEGSEQIESPRVDQKKPMREHQQESLSGDFRLWEIHRDHSYDCEE